MEARNLAGETALDPAPHRLKPSDRGASGPDAPVQLSRLAVQEARRYSTDTLSPEMLCQSWRMVELLSLLAVSLAAILLYEMPTGAMLWRYAVISACGAVAGLACIQIFGGYEISALRRLPGHVLPVAGGWAVGLASVALGFFFLKIDDQMSPAWLALWYAAGLTALGGARLVFGVFVRRWTRAGRLEKRVVIVGGGQTAEELIRTLNAKPDNDIRICGIFDDRGDRRSPPLVEGYRKLGNILELVEFMRLARIDMLIVTLPMTAEKRVVELMRSLWVLPADIRIVARHTRWEGDEAAANQSTLGPVQLLDVFNKPITGWGAVVKRIFDVVIASLAITALAPVMLGTAVAIRLNSRGPLLFRQKRHGFNNQIIEVLKFRSMYHEKADYGGKVAVTKTDPRVTSVGRVIRKTSIDELPQLWNVIRGELSLVGPRPHAVHARSSQNETYMEIVDGYFGRHKVKPGMTGLAQVNGFRGEIDQPEKLRKRVEYDLRYIDRWSLFLDIAILVKTPFSLFNTENAY